jgi:hypothetical protein
VGRLTRRIYIYGLDGLVGIPQNFQVCRSQYARNKAIARSIQEIATPHDPAFSPIANPRPPVLPGGGQRQNRLARFPYAFKNQIRLIKFSVAS